MLRIIACFVQLVNLYECLIKSAVWLRLQERGYSQFPLHEVHKVAVLDLRLGNSDRNGGNILVRRNASSGEWELIPIDHGYCLPGSFEDLSFEWMYW